MPFTQEQIIEILSRFLPYIASGLFSFITYVVGARRSAARDALSAANEQIGIQAKSYESLSQKYNELLARFDASQKQWLAERDQMHAEIIVLRAQITELAESSKVARAERDIIDRKFNVAMQYIAALHDVLVAKKIQVPPMPEDLRAFSPGSGGVGFPAAGE